MSANKTGRELAVELTTAIVKARSEVIVSIEHNASRLEQLKTQLNTAEVLDVFEKAYSSIKDK